MNGQDRQKSDGLTQTSIPRERTLKMYSPIFFCSLGVPRSARRTRCRAFLNPLGQAGPNICLISSVVMGSSRPSLPEGGNE